MLNPDLDYLGLGKKKRSRIFGVEFESFFFVYFILMDGVCLGFEGLDLLKVVIR